MTKSKCSENSQEKVATLLSSSLFTALAAGVVAAITSWGIQTQDHDFESRRWYTQSLQSEKFTEFREMVVDDLDLTVTALSDNPRVCEYSRDPSKCSRAENLVPNWQEYSRAVSEFGDESITDAWINVQRNLKSLDADIDAFILLAYFQAVLKSTYLGQNIKAEQVIKSYVDSDVWIERKAEIRQRMNKMGLTGN